MLRNSFIVQLPLKTMPINLLVWLGVLFGGCEPSTVGQTYAVVIGIADYQALTYATGDLRYADRDARQMVAFLRSKTGGTIPASNLILLTNRQATQVAINKALQLFRQADSADRVVLYFSGHGVPDGFVPYDVRPGRLDHVLTYAQIKAAFRASKAITKLCIADACLSGGLTKPQLNRTTIPKQAADGSSVAMMLASRSSQSAVEVGTLAGGAFTHFMLRGLAGRADADRNGIVTIRELHRYVSPQVKRQTKGRQTPIFYGRFPDNLALTYL